MNKAQLIDKLSTQLGSKKAATDAVDAVVDTITRAVASGERVAITGFGVFEKVARPARVGRNPRTGAAVKIKKTTVPKFKAGPGLQGRRQRRQEAARRPRSQSRSAATGTATPAKKTTAKKTTAKKTTAKKAPAKKASAKKTLAKKAPAKKAPAKKAAGARRPRPRRRPRASASPTAYGDGPGHPTGFPGPSASCCSASLQGGDGEERDARPVDLDAHPLADPQQPEPPASNAGRS